MPTGSIDLLVTPIALAGAIDTLEAGRWCYESIVISVTRVKEERKVIICTNQNAWYLAA